MSHKVRRVDSEVEERLLAVQNFIHYRFKEVKHLRVAITHSSYANEQGGDMEHNERLEFLGDAVLELTVSEELFKRFPNCREGEMTSMRARLVSKPTLSEMAKDFGLASCLLLGKGEDNQGGRVRGALLGDAMESLIGAVFLDAGYETTKQWVLWAFRDRWPDSSSHVRVKDFKSRLQELTQKLFKDRPIYVLEDTTGPDHGKTFVIRLTLPSGEQFLAKGSNIKKAEQNAAENALTFLEQEIP